MIGCSTVLVVYRKSPVSLTEKENQEFSNTSSRARLLAPPPFSLASRLSADMPRPLVMPMSNRAASSSHRGQGSQRGAQSYLRGKKTTKSASSKPIGIATTGDAEPAATEEAAALLAEVTALRAENALLRQELENRPANIEVTALRAENARLKQELERRPAPAVISNPAASGATGAITIADEAADEKVATAVLAEQGSAALQEDVEEAPNLMHRGAPLQALESAPL